MSSFKIIRAGDGYNPVIVVSPADASPYAPGSTYYERSRIQDGRGIPGWKDGAFNEISHENARYAFYPMADGWGYAELPDCTFPSLDAVIAFIREKTVSKRE